MGRLTVGAIVMQVCDAMEKRLLHWFIKFDNTQEIIDGFACMGFFMGLMCLLVVQPLPTPPGMRIHTQKGVFLHGATKAVDHRGRFTDLNAGWSGRVHNGWILGTQLCLS